MGSSCKAYCLQNEALRQALERMGVASEDWRELVATIESAVATRNQV